MIKKKIISALLAGAMIVTALAGCSVSADDNKTGKMRELTTTEIVADMGIGINLGNTFEACGSWISNSAVSNYERGWGSPIITKEMIKGYKDAGFGVMRVPVAWSNMMGDDYTINPAYMARVHEVVDWILDEDMYVILNIHYDGGWWEKFPTDKENCMKKYKRIWTQLCEEYKDYGDKLMFESLNEELNFEKLWNRWGSKDGKEEAYAIANEINQEFVTLVRASGTKNEKRHLLIAGYSTDIELTCDELFKMPNDPSNRMAISIHYYTPATFCILEKDASWGKARTEWGTDADLAELENNLNMMKTNYIDKGIPVIMGEFGVSTKNKTEEMVRYFMTTVCESAYSKGICPVVWDITDVFYKRTECKMIDPQLEKNFKDIHEKYKADDNA